MKSKKDNIKNIFSSKLGGFDPDLPPLLWEKIDAGLSSRQTVSSSSKKNVVYKYLAWTASVAAVILAVLILYPENADKEINALVAIPKQISSVPLVNEVKPEIAENTYKNEVKDIPATDILSADRSNRSLTASKSNPSKVKTTALPVSSRQTLSSSTNNVTNSLQQNNTDQALCASTAIVEDKHESQQYLSQENKSKFEKELADQIAAFEAEGKKNTDLLAYNASVDNLRSVDSEASSSKGIELALGGSSSFSKSNDVQTQLRHTSLFELASRDMVTSAYTPQQVKLEHNQPVSFGVAVSKKISNRVSIETGIIYTYLSSKVKSVQNADYKLKDSQYLHYLGIPLSVNYKLAEWRKLQLYLSAGGVVQKDFYGKINTTQSIQDLSNTKELIYKNISQDRAQFSLTSSLGLSYPIYNQFSVYTNLGGAYYIDANNKYETIYSDKKWVFNLNLGLKFGF